MHRTSLKATKTSHITPEKVSLRHRQQQHIANATVTQANLAPFNKPVSPADRYDQRESISTMSLLQRDTFGGGPNNADAAAIHALRLEQQDSAAGVTLLPVKLVTNGSP